MAREHAPSRSRRILSEAGQFPIPGLMDEAREIEDPSWAAVTLFKLAAHPTCGAKEARQARDDGRALLARIERPSRFAEVLPDLLKRTPGSELGPLQDAVLDILDGLPDGAWTDAAVRAAAPYFDADGRRRLLERALQNRGLEAEGAKAVLRAGGPREAQRLRPVLEAVPDAALRTRLLGHVAQSDALAPDATARTAADAAWTIPDAAQRTEALRVLAWQAPLDAVDALAASVKDRDLADSARFLTTLGARADKLGDAERAHRLLHRAVGLLPGIHDEKARTKVARKVAEALERAGLDAGPAQEHVVSVAPVTEAPAPEAPVEPAAPAAEPEAPAAPEPAAPEPPTPERSGARNTLAIVDAYKGGLGAPHLRAVARAAPLCVAFDLDLLLIGFPTDDADALVRAAQAETNVGEGARYAAQLRKAGRLRLMPFDGIEGALASFPTVVATTPHPEAGRAIARLEDAVGPVCLLVGQGKTGLPRKLLDAADHHYELTGRGISLETATAMGILAERLGRVAQAP